MVVALGVWLLSSPSNDSVSFQTSGKDFRLKASQGSLTESSTTQAVAMVKDTSSEPQVQMIETAIAAQISDAAKTYEFNSKFPPYSKPLNANNWNLLNPRPFIPRKQVLELGDGVQGVITLDSYVIHNDRPMNVTVTLRSESGSESVGGIDSVSAQLPASGESIALQTEAHSHASSHSNSHSNSSASRVLTGVFSVDQLATLNSGEQSLLVQVTTPSGDFVNLSTQFKLVATQASLVSIGTAYVDGAHLMVPAQFSSDNPGKYRLQANVFTEDMKTPIAHVNETFELDSGETTTNLRVHASTLRLAGAAGPYVLTGINLTKVSTKPGEPTLYGDAQQTSYSINGFDLALYDDSEYSNPDNEARLQFLRNISGQPM